jgi:hypothetical protein
MAYEVKIVFAEFLSVVKQADPLLTTSVPQVNPPYNAVFGDVYKPQKLLAFLNPFIAQLGVVPVGNNTFIQFFHAR